MADFNIVILNKIMPENPFGVASNCTNYRDECATYNRNLNPKLNENTNKPLSPIVLKQDVDFGLND